MTIWRRRKASVKWARYVAAEPACHPSDPSCFSSDILLLAAAEPPTGIGIYPIRIPPAVQAIRDFLPISNHIFRLAAYRRNELTTGLFALALAAMPATAIVMNAVHATPHNSIGQSRQVVVGSLATGPIVAEQPTVTEWRIIPIDQTGSGKTTLPTGQQENSRVLATSSGVNAVAYSPDGKLLAGAYGDGTVRVWDPATGQPTGSPMQAGSGVNGVAFSPDGKLLASADANGTIRLWDPATGQSRGGTPPGGSGSLHAVNGVAFSPDGKLLAGAYG